MNVRITQIHDYFSRITPTLPTANYKAANELQMHHQMMRTLE